MLFVKKSWQGLANAVWQAFDWIGAHKVHDRAEQERERARQRFTLAFLGVSISLIVSHIFSDDPLAFFDPIIAIVAVYGFGSLIYYRFLLSNPSGGVAVQYLFMASDACLMAGTVAYKPDSMGWLSLLLITVIARTSIRYGVRSLYFVWGIASLTSAVAWTFIAIRGDLLAHKQVFMIVVGSLVIAAPMFVQAVRGIAVNNEFRQKAIRLDQIKAQIGRRMEFLSMVSHELRSPLQSMLSSIELLEMDLGRDVHAREVERLGLSAKAMGAQLNDIATLVRGEIGVVAFEPEPTSVQDAFMEACEAVEPVARMKGVDLQVRLPEEDLTVCIDKVRLSQIAANLLMSSVKYTHKGWIRLELHPFSEGDTHFSFSVVDTGGTKGRAAAESMFTSYDRKGEEVYPSSSAGIGLAVVKLVVDFLDGSVKVTKTAGGESCLTVSLPACQVGAEKAQARSVLIVGKRLIEECRELGGADALDVDVAEARTMGHAMMLMAARPHDLLLYDARSMHEPEPVLLRTLERARAEGAIQRAKVVVRSVGMWQSKATCVVTIIEEPLTLKKLRRELGQA